MGAEVETRKHIGRVRELLMGAAQKLLDRAVDHDRSKLQEPEKSIFEKNTKRLKGLTYGSEEYKQALDDLGPALKHHYAMNSHHPEHYTEGVMDMDLFDLMEMYFDWVAAVERHDDGDIRKSIKINKKRFGLCDQICQVFLNTYGYKRIFHRVLNEIDLEYVDQIRYNPDNNTAGVVVDEDQYYNNNLYERFWQFEKSNSDPHFNVIPNKESFNKELFELHHPLKIYSR